MSNAEEMLMLHCLELAGQGLGLTRSNPMVAALLVCDGQIVGQGWHKRYGEAHAEVNAIASVQDKDQIKKCVLYVNLEPCSHFGKTPPCVDLILKNEIKNIVIGSPDPNPKVAGEGIKKLRQAGCAVRVGILEAECRQLNRRFYTFHEKERPWIILKWAQSADGYVSKNSDEQIWLSSKESRALVHKWRTEEMGILIGTRTAMTDNPQLNARLSSGTSPTRIIIDRNLSLPKNLKVFDGSSPTIIFCENNPNNFTYPQNVEIVKMNFNHQSIQAICTELYKRKIVSCIIEGGAKTINYWIKSNIWDEARIFESEIKLFSGIKAPTIPGSPVQETLVSSDKLSFYSNGAN